MKLYFHLILLFLSCNVIAQRSFDQILLQNFIDSTLEHSPLSIYAVDMETGKELIATKPQFILTPASVQKLITSAAALEILGPNFRFKTTIWHTGEIRNGILEGDLVITGGGDPTLGSLYFNSNESMSDFLDEWVNSIRKAGIQKIAGDIVADASIYIDQDVPQTWIWEDMGNYYGAAAQGISVYDNTFNVYFNMPNEIGSQTSIVKIWPDIPGLNIKNEVVSANDNKNNAYLYGSPFDSYRVIRGTLPAGSKAYKVRASIPEPSLILANQLKEVLIAKRIKMSGTIQKKKLRMPDFKQTHGLIVEWQSPLLSEIIEQLNYFSINLYAEHLCKHLGLIVNQIGTTDAGTTVIKDFWQSKGVDTNMLFLADGSGLSRFNACTAKTLVDVLQYMYNKSENYDAFYNSIPVTGIEGTQLYYFQNSFLKGKIKAKSGSMTRVRSFAGYMGTPKGTKIAFAIIANNFTCTSTEMAKKMEVLMEQIYLNY